MHVNSVLLIKDGTNMAMKPRKESYGFGNSSYDIKNDGTEYLTVTRKTKIPGVAKLVGKTYEVPKGTMKTAKAERGKTEGRLKTASKIADVAAARKRATKRLASETSRTERSRTASRKTDINKRQAAKKEAAKKPKRLY